ncbi:hypothetical protein [Plantibacter sp. CFBP 8804]|nr:hypothetical protein [Plantibacter sp. CFBP 8804]
MTVDGLTVRKFTVVAEAINTRWASDDEHVISHPSIELRPRRS